MSLNISFKVSGGDPFSLELEPSLTVGDVKGKAAEKTGFDAATMKLIYKGRILKDKETLESHNVETGHTMHIVKGAGGGA